MSASTGYALPPTKVVPSVIKVIGTLEDTNERKLGVQNVPMDAWNNFSSGVSFRKCHLTNQDATCPLSLALDPWRTGRVLERSHGVQDIHRDVRNNFSFCAPLRKCHLTHQDATCPPSLELDPWRTGMIPDRSLHFNVNNNPTL